MKQWVAFLITVYQRYVSPHKGFRCAYASLHGGESCSQVVKQLVLQQGCVQSWQPIKTRFAACKTAQQTLMRNKQKSKRQARCDCPGDIPDCGSCDMPDSISCDAPCDVPCDCSF